MEVCVYKGRAYNLKKTAQYEKQKSKAEQNFKLLRLEIIMAKLLLEGFITMYCICKNTSMNISFIKNSITNRHSFIP